MASENQSINLATRGRFLLEVQTPEKAV